MIKRSLTIVAVFGLGVGFGCAAAPLVVPKANAQQEAALPRWEHLCFDARSVGELNAALQKAGDARWELAGLALQGSSAMACLKRPKP